MRGGRGLSAGDGIVAIERDGMPRITRCRSIKAAESLIVVLVVVLALVPCIAFCAPNGLAFVWVSGPWSAVGGYQAYDARGALGAAGGGQCSGCYNGRRMLGCQRWVASELGSRGWMQCWAMAVNATPHHCSNT